MRITAKTKLLGLFADPANHSKSPEIFNAIFEKRGLEYAYMAFKISKGKIRDALETMRLLDMKGSNISMPHKEDIIPYLDEVSSEALFCNAVNTVVNENGILKGYNTDILGAVKALEAMGVSISGSDIALLGLGGAGKAVLTGIAEHSPSKVKAFVRGVDALNSNSEESAFHAQDALRFIDKVKDKYALDIELLDVENHNTLKTALSEVDILINASGVGMGLQEGRSLIPDISFLSAKPAVLDVIYSPEKTLLLTQAEEAGCRYSNGLNMLIGQAEAAFRLLIGEKVEKEEIYEIIKSKS